MNKLRNLTAPDFVLGKVLIYAKSILDIIILFARKPSRQSLEFAGLILKVKPRYTMVTNKKLINLYNLVHKAINLDLPGDIVECGVWHGGSAAVMAVALRDLPHTEERTLWLFDSFQGLPPPDEKDGRKAKEKYFQGWNRGDPQKVEEIFGKCGVSMDSVRIVPGWFESTLKTTPVGSIAILHIDADWYSSVNTVLETLYYKVVPGGFIVLDDYGVWPGCSQAVADFFLKHSIEDIVISRLEDRRGGAYFQKPW